MRLKGAGASKHRLDTPRSSERPGSGKLFTVLRAYVNVTAKRSGSDRHPQARPVSSGEVPASAASISADNVWMAKGLWISLIPSLTAEAAAAL